MRTLENKETSMENEKGNMGYVDLIQICLDHMPKDGFTTSVMKKRLDVTCVLEDVELGASVDIEENIYETIAGCVKGFAWGRIHKDLVQFEDDIIELKEHKKG